MEITGRVIGWSVTSLPYHCNQLPALLAVWIPVISVASDPLIVTRLTSDLKQTPTWSKLSRTGYRHLTRISCLPGFKPWYSFTLGLISALGGGGWSSSNLRSLCPWERAPQTILQEAGWDGCRELSCTHRPSKPEPSSLWWVDILNVLTRPWICDLGNHVIIDVFIDFLIKSDYSASKWKNMSLINCFGRHDVRILSCPLS